MPGIVRAAVLGGVLALALPVPAYACTPALHQLIVTPERVPAGGRVSISGEQRVRPNGAYVTGCDGWTGQVPAEPTPTAATIAPGSPSPTPLVSVPPLPTPLAPRATVAAAPAHAPVLPPVVELRIAPTHEWDEPEPPSRFFAQVAANAPVSEVYGTMKQTVTKYAFSASVRLPRDLAPGFYEITADQKGAINFGTGLVEVADALSATGAPAFELVGIAALCLVTGAYALTLARARRA